MKKKILDEIINKKKLNVEFALITNLENGDGFIFEKNKPIDQNLSNLMRILIYISIERKTV